jgi:hypothetical protein
VGDLGLLALRGRADGAVVVAFALIGETVGPKAFSGLFSRPLGCHGEPGTDVRHRRRLEKTQQASTGMGVGGVAMVAGCLLAAVTIPRIRASGALWRAGSGGQWSISDFTGRCSSMRINSRRGLPPVFPAITPRDIRGVRLRDCLIRFVLGAVISLSEALLSQAVSVRLSVALVRPGPVVPGSYQATSTAVGSGGDLDL